LTATTEPVWLEDVTDDITSRHLESGLPDELGFLLSRLQGDQDHVPLSLKQNKRLNQNVPMFEMVTENGRQRVVKKESKPIHVNNTI